jgi:RNA polymerase sigma-70 factor (ECF subfamily)
MSDQLATHVAGLFVQVRPAEGSACLDAAFANLYSSAFSKVYAFIRSQVQDASVAQEIVSRVFLKAYCNCDKAPANDGAISWVFRIAYTTLVDYWRVEGRRRAADVPLEELDEVDADGANNPETTYLRRERQSMLLKAVGTLQVSDRALLALKFSAQRTNREIAAILGLKEGAVSMRLLRALRRLRQRLNAMGIS